MHAYILTRGQKEKVDAWIRDLQAQYFPYKTSPHAESPPAALQLGVRPVQFWEIAFPKECLPEVMALLNASTFDTKDKRKINRLFAWILKLANVFGLKPVPKDMKPAQRRMTCRESPAYAIDVKCIGLKDD